MKHQMRIFVFLRVLNIFNQNELARGGGRRSPPPPRWRRGDGGWCPSPISATRTMTHRVDESPRRPSRPTATRSPWRRAGRVKSPSGWRRHLGHRSTPTPGHAGHRHRGRSGSRTTMTTTTIHRRGGTHAHRRRGAGRSSRTETETARTMKMDRARSGPRLVARSARAPPPPTPPCPAASSTSDAVSAMTPTTTMTTRRTETTTRWSPRDGKKNATRITDRGSGPRPSPAAATSRVASHPPSSRSRSTRLAFRAAPGSTRGSTSTDRR